MYDIHFHSLFSGISKIITDNANGIHTDNATKTVLNFFASLYNCLCAANIAIELSSFCLVAIPLDITILLLLL